MPSWEDLQLAYQQQETAWDDYWVDLSHKAEAAKLAFQDYLGVTDNVLSREGKPAQRKVMLGKEVNGTWQEAHRHELEGNDRSIHFGIGVTTYVDRRAEGVFLSISLKRLDGIYSFEVNHPHEVIQIADAGQPDSFNRLCDALYLRFQIYYSHVPE